MSVDLGRLLGPSLGDIEDDSDGLTGDIPSDLEGIDAEMKRVDKYEPKSPRGTMLKAMRMDKLETALKNRRIEIDMRRRM